MTGRSPQTVLEQVLANCRPQPAIPAVLALLLMVLLPAMLAPSDPDQIGAWLLWLIPAGIAVSCGLAIAAGFCSLAPQAIWMVLAVWALSLIGRAGFPEIHSITVYAGMVAVFIMFAVQVWRIATRRFVPTMRDHLDNSPD